MKVITNFASKIKTKIEKNICKCQNNLNALIQLTLIDEYPFKSDDESIKDLQVCQKHYSDHSDLDFSIKPPSMKDIKDYLISVIDKDKDYCAKPRYFLVIKFTMR